MGRADAPNSGAEGSYAPRESRRVLAAKIVRATGFRISDPDAAPSRRSDAAVAMQS